MRTPKVTKPDCLLEQFSLHCHLLGTNGYPDPGPPNPTSTAVPVSRIAFSFSPSSPPPFPRASSAPKKQSDDAYLRWFLQAQYFNLRALRCGQRLPKPDRPPTQPLASSKSDTDIDTNRQTDPSSHCKSFHSLLRT